MTSRQTAAWWSLSPFGTDANWISKKPGEVEDIDLQHTFVSIARDLQRSLGGAPLESNVNVADLVKRYFDNVAPERTRAERHIRHVVEQLTLLDTASGGATVAKLATWIREWATHDPGALAAPTSALAAPTDDWNAVLRAVHNPDVARDGLAMAPIPNLVAMALRNMQTTMLSNSTQLAKSQAGDLNTLATMLAEQNTRLASENDMANANVNAIRAGLNAVASAAGATVASGVALTAANIERAAEADAFVRSVTDAVATKRQMRQANKDLLAAVKEVASTINDTAVLPRIMRAGDLPRPFNASSISHVSAAMVTEALTWQQEIARDDQAFVRARQALTNGLQLVYTTLQATPSYPSNLDMSNLGTVRDALVTAAHQQRTSRDDMDKFINSAVLLVADTTSALGVTGRFRRDQAATAVAFVKEALDRIDQDVQDSFLAAHGLMSGIVKIVDSFGLRTGDYEALNRLIGDINQHIKNARDESAAERAAREQSDRSSPIVPDERRVVAMDGVRTWLAQQRDTTGSVYKAHQAVAALRMLLAQTAEQRRDGARRLEELEKLSVDVMREGMALFGPQAHFVRETAANSDQQVAAMDKARADAAFAKRIQVIRGTIKGIAAVQTALAVTQTPVDFRGPWDLRPTDDPTKLLASADTARAAAYYLIKDAATDTENTNAALTQVRASLAAADGARRDSLRRIEELEKLSVDVMRDGMALFGPQAHFVRDTAATSDEQVATMNITPADPTFAGRIKTIKGTIGGLTKLQEAVLPTLTLVTFNGPQDVTINEHSRVVVAAAAGTTRAYARYLITYAAEETKVASETLSKVRAALAVADGARRDGAKKIEELEKLSVDVMREGMALFGPQARFMREAAANSDRQVTDAVAGDADAAIAERIAAIAGAVAGINRLQSVLLSPPPVVDTPSRDVTFQEPSDLKAGTVATYLIKDAADAAKTTAGGLSQARAALAVADATRRVGAQRLDELQRDLYATVVQYTTALGGGRIPGATQPDRMMAVVDAAAAAWTQERQRQNAALTDTLTGTLQLFKTLGIDTALVRQPPENVSDLLPYTLGNAVALARDAVNAITAPTSNFDAANAELKGVLDASAGPIATVLDRIKTNVKNMDERRKALNALVDAIDRQMRASFPGSSVLSKTGTLNDRLIQVLQQTAVDQYNRDAAEYNSQVQEIATVAGTLFGQVQAFTLAPSISVEGLLAAAQQPDLTPAPLAQELQAVRSYVTAVNASVRQVERLTKTLHDQVGDIKKAIRDVDADHLRRLDDERARALDATYSTAVSAFIAATVAYANGNHLPLRNAIEFALSTIENRAWNLTNTADGSVAYIRADPRTPSMLFDFEKMATLSFVPALMATFASIEAATLQGFAALLKQTITNMLSFYEKRWYEANGGGRQVVADLRNLFLDTGTSATVPAVPADQTESTLFQSVQHTVDGNYPLWVVRAARLVLGVMMYTPAYLTNARTSQFAYDASSSTTVAMLLARQLAETVRGHTDIAAQRESIERDLEVVRIAASMPVAIKQPADLEAYACDLASELSRGQNTPALGCGSAPVAAAAPLFSVIPAEPVLLPATVDDSAGAVLPPSAGDDSARDGSSDSGRKRRAGKQIARQYFSDSAF